MELMKIDVRLDSSFLTNRHCVRIYYLIHLLISSTLFVYLFIYYLVCQSYIEDELIRTVVEVDGFVGGSRFRCVVVLPSRVIPTQYYYFTI